MRVDAAGGTVTWRADAHASGVPCVVKSRLYEAEIEQKNGLIFTLVERDAADGRRLRSLEVGRDPAGIDGSADVRDDGGAIIVDAWGIDPCS